jgi:hypothetical protein
MLGDPTEFLNKKLVLPENACCVLEKADIPPTLEGKRKAPKRRNVCPQAYFITPSVSLATDFLVKVLQEAQ